MSKRKLKTLSLREKFEVIKALKSGTRKKDVAVQYGLPASTLSTLIKNEAEILLRYKSSSNYNLLRKRRRQAEFPDLEECLLTWLKECRDKNICINGPILREKAQEFAKSLRHSSFRASNGWLGNFKKRHELVFKKALEGQADSNQRTNDASDQNEPDGQGSQLLVAKTETFDLDLDPLFETQDVSDSEYSEEMPDEASTSEVKTESRGKSCCIDTCPTHTRLLEAILSCVSRQEQSAARAANAQEQMARAQESQLRIQEALMRTQEAQTHALEKIARLLEDRPQRL